MLIDAMQTGAEMKKIRLIPFLLWLITLSASGFAAEINWVAHWLDEAGREELVHEVAREFRFLNPDITLNIEFAKTLENEGNNFKWKSAYRIADMVKTGEITADVVFLDPLVYNHTTELLNDPHWGKKHLLDVSGMKWFQKSQKEFILNSPYYKNQTGGIFVGPFIEGFYTCLWMNTAVAEATGIKVKERAMSIDDFFSYAQQLSNYNKQNNTSIPFIKVACWNRIDILFEYLFKTLCDDPYFAIEEKYDRKKEQLFYKTLLVFEKLSKYQSVTNADYESLSIDQWIHEYLDGDGLFIVAGTYIHSQFSGIYPEKYADAQPVELPYINHPNGLVGDYIPVYAVMKNSPNKDAALKLLQLWSEPKIADKWVAYTKNPTGIRGNLVLPASDTADDVYEDFVFDMNARYSHLPMRYIRSPTYIFGDKNPVKPNELRESLMQILLGTMTAREYYEDVLERFRKQ